MSPNAPASTSAPTAASDWAAAASANPAARQLMAQFADALNSVLDMIVPANPGRRMPAASEVGVLDYICRFAPDALAEIQTDFEVLDAQARQRHNGRFGSLAEADKRALVDALRQARPEFLQRLALETVSAYYHDPRVLAALDIEDRPPFPQGHQVVAGDLLLLEPVRRRGKFYRDA